MHGHFGPKVYFLKACYWWNSESGEAFIFESDSEKLFLLSYERVDRVDHVGINFLVYIQGGSSKTAKMSSKSLPVFVGKRHYRFFCYIAQNDRQS